MRTSLSPRVLAALQAVTISAREAHSQSAARGTARPRHTSPAAAAEADDVAADADMSTVEFGGMWLGVLGP